MTGNNAEVRVGLVGACGRMGQMLVKRVLATEGMTVSAAFDLVNIGKDIGEVVGVGALGVPVSDSKDLAQVLKDSKTDVLLDFTIAKATAVNAPVAAAAGVNLIIGTTGLSDEVKKDITDAVVKNNVAAVISTNYSIGVAVFNKLIRQAALLLGNDYDVEIIEAHHNQKQDAPSGTGGRATAPAARRSASTRSGAGTSSATIPSCSSATPRGSRSATRPTPGRSSSAAPSWRPAGLCQHCRHKCARYPDIVAVGQIYKQTHSQIYK